VGVGEKSVIQNVELANEASLEDVNDDDVDELLQSHGERLSNDELRELADQRIQSEYEVFVAEEEATVRDLTTQNSSAIASPRSRKSWTSSSIMTLTGSESIRQSEVSLT
jgi:hypothetical protein